MSTKKKSRSTKSPKEKTIEYYSNTGLAHAAGVSAQAIAASKKLQAVKTKKGFDLNHPVVKDYIQTKTSNSPINRSRALQTIQSAKMRGISFDESGTQLKNTVKQNRKSIAEIQAEHEEDKASYTRERMIHVQLGNLEKKKQTVGYDVVSIWIGCFAPAILNNLLTIGDRVARGDKELKKRVDSEVSRGLKKALEQAARELKSKDFKEFFILGDLIDHV